MTIKVYGVPISTAMMRVVSALNEKGLDFEFCLINMGEGEHKKEPYLSLNPFGQVPAFEDGDLKLFESRAITGYVAHGYADKGNNLVVEDPKKMAILAIWMEVEAHQFDPPAAKLTFELGIKPFLGMVTDEAVVEENQGKLGKVLDVYEKRLAESKYLGGDSFTLADMHHQPNVQYLLGTKAKILFDSRPHVSAWCADILSRPAWKKVVAMRDNK